MDYMKTNQQKDKKKDAFFRLFAGRIHANIKSVAVPDALWSNGWISGEERKDCIGDLSTYERRRAFWDIMQTKDYEVIPVLIQVLEDNLSGQSSMVDDMKQFLRQTDPALAQKLLSPAGAGQTFTSNANFVSPAVAVANTPDYSFKVTYGMLPGIVDLIFADVQAQQRWGQVFTDFAKQSSDHLRIRTKLKDPDRLHEAMSDSMQPFVATTCGTFQQMLDLFEKRELNALVVSLKAAAESIKNN